jgi:hypothetical protein
MEFETKRTTVVLNALRVTSRVLSEVPESPEGEELRARLADCEKEAMAWRATAPTPEQRGAMMKRVLILHAAVAKLARERDAPI